MSAPGKRHSATRAPLAAALALLAALAAALALLAALAIAPARGAAEPASPDPPPEPPRQLSFENERWSGDFDAMLERRMIRVLVPYSRTLYFNDKGQERGITAELVRDFEAFLNRKYVTSLGRRPITVYMVPTRRDALIEGVATGLGDIAAGNLTETPERLERVDFVAPRDREPAREVVVRGLHSLPVATIRDLAGRTVHVRRSSSYHGSLLALGARLEKDGLPPIRLVIVPEALEDEDLMEMSNAGLVELLVVDRAKARAWARVLPEIQVTDVVVAEGGYTGWAIRKQSPLLAEEIRDFYLGWAKKTGVIEYRNAMYLKQIRQISNNTATDAWKRFERMLALFEKYGAMYRFDPLMLAAQGYQESRLRQDARSRAGAIGVMQIMPATGAELRVGDIRELEANIHAGAKYLDQVLAVHFADAELDPQERVLFALASYNAGPTRIARLRAEAQRRGLDPNRWFENVEIVVAEKVGIETTTYVRNIFKYFTAYKLQLDALGEREKALERLMPPD